jgi:hypothetical protein
VFFCSLQVESFEKGDGSQIVRTLLQKVIELDVRAHIPHIVMWFKEIFFG